MTDEELDRLSDTEIQRLWEETPEGKARTKLYYGLLDLESDPDIQKSKVCMEFLRLMSVFSPTSPEPDSIQDVVDHLGAAFNTLRGVKNSRKRHAPANNAKEFVQAEWRLHNSAYRGNKSAFARDYVRRLKHELGVTITEKQMREVWLKDAPPASKPDGMPADG